MKKSAFLLSCLALSFGALADKQAPTSAPAALPVPHDAGESKAQIKAAKERGALMAACLKKSADQDLYQVERQQFLAACMAGK